MNPLVIVVLLIIIGIIIYLFNKSDAFSTSFAQPEKKEKRNSISRGRRKKTETQIENDKKRDAAIEWLAQFLQVDIKYLNDILLDMYSQYLGSFWMRKKSGGFRRIHAPSKELLKIQQLINQRILQNIQLHPACVGFRFGKSVKDNAAPHLGKPYVLKMDLYEFFPSISRDRVRKAFANIGYPIDIANQLSHLCCYKGRLPQGAATSPTLSNIIARDLDVVLMQLAQSNDLVYTRYADDLTFSGNYIDYDKLIPEIYTTIRKERFYPNQSKTRKLIPNRRKIITGVSVSNGDKMTIPRAKKREIRQVVYHIKTKGLEAHLAKLDSKDTCYLKRILGYLHFWNHVEPSNTFVVSSIAYLQSLK